MWYSRIHTCFGIFTLASVEHCCTLHAHPGPGHLDEYVGRVHGDTIQCRPSVYLGWDLDLILDLIMDLDSYIRNALLSVCFGAIPHTM